MEVLPDRVADAVLDEVHRTRQRTVFGPWRTRPVSRTTFAAAAVVALLALGAALLVVAGGPSPGDAERGAQPQPAGHCGSKLDPARAIGRADRLAGHERGRALDRHGDDGQSSP